jgi:hypothetical protein
MQVRTSMRKNIDILAAKALMYIDWPSAATSVPRSMEFNLMALTAYQPDCDKAVPSENLNWRSAQHRALAINYCFERLHYQLAVPRKWASGAGFRPDEATRFLKQTTAREALDRQLDRVRGFMRLGVLRIEEIRLRYRTDSFSCHLLGLGCA